MFKFVHTSKAKEKTPQILKKISKNDPTVPFPLKPQIYLKVPPGATFRSAGKSASHQEASSSLRRFHRDVRDIFNHKRKSIALIQKSLQKEITIFGDVRTIAKVECKIQKFSFIQQNSYKEIADSAATSPSSILTKAHKNSKVSENSFE